MAMESSKSSSVYEIEPRDSALVTAQNSNFANSSQDAMSFSHRKSGANREQRAYGNRSEFSRSLTDFAGIGSFANTPSRTD